MGKYDFSYLLIDKYVSIINRSSVGNSSSSYVLPAGNDLVFPDTFSSGMLC